MRKRVSTGLLVSLAILVLGLTADAALLFDKSEYAARRKNLIEKIPGGLAVIFGAQNVTGYTEYFQNNDLMYFSGVEIPNSILVIDGVNKDSALFFTISEREAQGENISLDLVRRPQDYTGIERYYPAENFSDYLARRLHDGSRCRLYAIPAGRADAGMRGREDAGPPRRHDPQRMGRTAHPGASVRQAPSGAVSPRPRSRTAPGSSPTSGRSSLRPRSRFCGGPAGSESRPMIEIMKATRPEIYEYELAALFEYVCKKEGAQSLAYNVIMSSAENHPFLHYYKHNRRLVDGDFLVVDAGPDVGYYDVDITISYPANGVFTPRQREIYEACQIIEETCLSLTGPGSPARR